MLLIALESRRSQTLLLVFKCDDSLVELNSVVDVGIVVLGFLDLQSAEEFLVIGFGSFWVDVSAVGLVVVEGAGHLFGKRHDLYWGAQGVTSAELHVVCLFLGGVQATHSSPVRNIRSIVVDRGLESRLE